MDMQQQQEPVQGFLEQRYLKIQKQIEYYFDEVNIFKDRHLKALINGNAEGWVPINEVMKFKHLQEITTIKNEVITAIKNRSQLVEISVDDENFRRRPDQPARNRKAVLDDYKRRSLYIGNFPRYTTFDEIKNEYLGVYGNVPSFVMRRDGQTQGFRGSIFATFETEELARQFLTNPAALIFHDKFLTRRMQLDYEKKHPPRPLPQENGDNAGAPDDAVNQAA